MSWQMWTFLILGIPGLIILIFGIIFHKAHPRGNGDVAAIGGGILTAIAVVVLLLGCFAIVGTRQIGILTTFGRPTGATLDNGLHWKAPWATTSEMDGAIQISKYDTDGHRVKVRLGNNSTADADVSIRWEIKQDAADDLYVQYKNFDKVHVNLIERNLQVALNEVFQTFDPLSTQWATGVPLQNFANDAAEKLRRIVGDQVKIFDVSVSRLDYDDRTEERINALNIERANTAVAEQSQKTAEAQKRANEIISSSINNNPNVLVSKCLDIVKEKGGNVFGCWPSAGAVPTIPAPIN